MGGTYAISVVGTAGPVWMTVHRQPCDSNTPIAPIAGHPNVYPLGFAVTAYIRIQGAGLSSGEGYQLRIARWYDDEQRWCGDSLDNDGNGLVDCADQACRQSPECRWPRGPTP
jgi:hypothetical protein